MSYEQHENNFRRLHMMYYDKQIKLYYEKFIKEIDNDESLSASEKYNFKEMFKEYVNIRVNSGNERTEEMKALNMYSIYVRNGKEINYSFLEDVKLVNILKSIDLCKRFYATLGPNKITNMFFKHWFYIAFNLIKEGSDKKRICDEATRELHQLPVAGIIDIETYQKICIKFRKEMDKCFPD